MYDFANDNFECNNVRLPEKIRVSDLNDWLVPVSLKHVERTQNSVDIRVKTKKSYRQMLYEKNTEN